MAAPDSLSPFRLRGLSQYVRAKKLRTGVTPFAKNVLKIVSGMMGVYKP